MHRAFGVLSGWAGLVALAGLLLIVGPAFAGAQSPLEEGGIRTDNVEAHLVTDTSALVPGESHRIALHLKIRDHWHTYWRYGGDSGAPTTISFTLPDGFKVSEIAWPIPKAIPIGPLVNLGYEGEVFHLIELSVPASAAPGTSVTLMADAEWLVCSDDVCIPEWGKFSLTLPIAEPGLDPLPDATWGGRIARAAAQLPLTAGFPVSAHQSGMDLQIAIADPVLRDGVANGRVTDLTFLPLQDGIIRLAGQQKVGRSGDLAVLTAPASYLAEMGKFPARLEGLLIATEGGARRGYMIDAAVDATLKNVAPLAPVARGDGPQGPAGGGLGFASALLFAFAGGLILNLMPCVFPVLSIKALSFAAKAASAPAEVRRHGWIFSAGVMTTFLALAVLLLALRAGGAEIGWGFQLQSPIFVLLIAYLMFAVGLGLAGAIDFGGRVAGVGQSLAMLPNGLGTFFTGVLASVVASPCTAPFMGAAVGYAVMAPSAAGVSVFLALGAGLAAPYLVLSHIPSAFRLLPKPGPWMERLKEFFAFPMFATAAWLIWVLAHQTGASGVFAALIGMVLIAFAAWLARIGGSGARALASRIAAGLALITAFALSAYASDDAHAPASSASSEGAIAWGAYSDDALAEALSSGRGTFVDLTAAWCITCKINQMGALSAPAVAKAFSARGIVALRGDWTNRDPAITIKLEEFGRAGVPLYLYYPPGETRAQVLPQILTEGAVLAALDRAP